MRTTTDVGPKFVTSEAREREHSFGRGRCEAICPARGYGDEHRCNFRGSETLDGHWVCGVHGAAMRTAARGVSS